MAVVAGQKLFAIVLISIEVVFLALFGFFGRYGPMVDPTMKGEEMPKLQDSYAMFTDIHIMIFVGFGFLMTFLRRYGYGAVGLNFLVGAISVQWAIIMQGTRPSSLFLSASPLSLQAFSRPISPPST